VEIQKGNRASAVITEMAYAGTIIVIEGVAYRIPEDRRAIDKMIFKIDANKEKIIMI
jgi:hypothetical protein